MIIKHISCHPYRPVSSPWRLCPGCCWLWAELGGRGGQQGPQRGSQEPGAPHLGPERGRGWGAGRGSRTGGCRWSPPAPWANQLTLHQTLRSKRRHVRVSGWSILLRVTPRLTSEMHLFIIYFIMLKEILLSLAITFYVVCKSLQEEHIRFADIIHFNWNCTFI